MKLRSLVLAGVVFASSLAGAELDKKQAGALSRAGQQITNAEKALEDYGEGKRWSVMTERVQGDFERKIQRAKDMLTDLPATDAGVKAELDHLKKLEAQLAARVAERTGKESAKAGAEAALDALLDGPAWEADKATLTEMTKIFENINWWKLDFYIWTRWTTHSDLEMMRGWGKRWAEMQKQYPALQAKYASALAFKGGVGKGKLTQKVMAAKDLIGDDANRDFTEYSASLAAFIKAVPAAIDEDGKTLRKLIDEAGAKNDWSAILNEDGKIQGVRNRLVNIPSVYATLVSESEGAAVTKSAKAAQDAAAAATTKFAEKLVASNTAPSNAYFGGDKDKLEALIKKEWKAKYPSETILGVRFRSSEFERTTQWVVDTNATTATKRDASRLRATVIIKHGAKEAAMWSVVVIKDHMANDKIEIGLGYRGKDGPTPEQRMLAANYK